MKSQKICILAVVLAVFFCLSACGGSDEAYNNIQCSSATVIYNGKQTVTLTAVTPIGGGEAASFKSNISVSDITLKDALAGKTVSDVTFIDETEIALTLDGVADRTPTGDAVADIGRIYVSSDALSSEGTGYCLVTVAKPMLKFEEKNSNISNGKRIITSRYTLQSGSFAADAKSLIALQDETVGTLTVEISGSEITFEVAVADVAVTSVEVIIPAAATSLNKQIVVNVGTYDSVEL